MYPRKAGILSLLLLLVPMGRVKLLMVELMGCYCQWAPAFPSLLALGLTLHDPMVMVIQLTTSIESYHFLFSPVLYLADLASCIDSRQVIACMNSCQGGKGCVWFGGGELLDYI